MQRFIAFALVSILFGCQSNQNADTNNETAQNQPNIILIVGDDHGYPYFGFMGADYVQTPNMDELAASGTLFTDGYVPDNHCRPSLATLITGILPVDYEKRVEQLIEDQKVSEEETTDFKHHAMKHFETLPKTLVSQGYNCFQGGKWWEFNYQNGGFSHGMTTGWTEKDREAGNDWFKKFMGGDGLQLARATMEPVYEFIEQNKEDPFFIWYAPELPHYPFDAPDRYYNLYKDQEMTESAKRYYANCTWFDEGVGELRRYLKEVGEFDNTLFIYVNDNGWEQAPDQEYWEDPMRSHNGGDKGKSSIYDMSFRTPIIFAWEGKIEAGRRLDHLVHSADIPATILNYLDLQIPNDYHGQSVKQALDGQEFPGRSEIMGNVTTVRDESSVMGKATEGYWVRDKNWFFRWDVTAGVQELFDMTIDPNNDHDLLNQHPEIAKQMIEKVHTYKLEKGKQDGS